MVAPVRDKVIKAPSWPRLRPAGLDTNTHAREFAAIYIYIYIIIMARY